MYYTVKWLERAGNQIGHTLRVDNTTLVASREKFVQVYVDVDLSKPLKAGTDCGLSYGSSNMRDSMTCVSSVGGMDIGLQAVKITKLQARKKKVRSRRWMGQQSHRRGKGGQHSEECSESGFGPWMIAQKIVVGRRDSLERTTATDRGHQARPNLTQTDW